MRTGRVIAAFAAALAIGAPLSAHAQTRPGGLPPADQPVIRRMPQPTLAVEGGAGIVGFVSGVGSTGLGWNVRVTGQMSERFAVEGNYVGSANERIDTRSSLVMTALDASLRYNLTLPDQLPVQPYVTAGVGYAGFAGRYGDAATLIVPLSAGAERMLTPNIKIGARLSYRPAFFDNLAATSTPAGENTPGADTWSLLAQLGGGF